MKQYTLIVPLSMVCGIVGWMIAGSMKSAAIAAPADDGGAQIEQLRGQIKHLEELVPDQAAVMTKVGYHFTNLYIAVQKENWPLADFYLGETINNIKWAVRTKPIRKDSAGRDIDLGAIAQAIENTQFKDLKEAIAAKDKQRCGAVYEQTLAACYGCHTASGKPYLRLQKPSEPEVKIIIFMPAAPESK